MAIREPSTPGCFSREFFPKNVFDNLQIWYIAHNQISGMFLTQPLATLANRTRVKLGQRLAERFKDFAVLVL